MLGRVLFSRCFASFGSVSLPPFSTPCDLLVGSRIFLFSPIFSSCTVSCWRGLFSLSAPLLFFQPLGSCFRAPFSLESCATTFFANAPRLVSFHSCSSKAYFFHRHWHLPPSSNFSFFSSGPPPVMTAFYLAGFVIAVRFL